MGGINEVWVSTIAELVSDLLMVACVAGVRSLGSCEVENR